MERIGIRELRNETSRVVRRAMAGEHLIVTIDGVPAAQLGPLAVGSGERTREELCAAGLLRRPRQTSLPPPAQPVRAPGGRSSTDVLREQRGR